MAVDSFLGLYLSILHRYINLTFTWEYIQVFHWDVFDCFIGFFEIFCNVSTTTAATIPIADCIDAHLCSNRTVFAVERFQNS